MKLVPLIISSLLGSASSFATIEAPISSQAPKPAHMKPGTIVIRKTLHGIPIRHSVLVVEEQRALTRVEHTEMIRYEWLDLKSISADPGTFRVLAPSPSPYESVLIPVSTADESPARTYERHTVTHMIVDDLGREILMTATGKLAGIGNHSIEARQPHGAGEFEMQPNVPVEKGETPPEAIDRHNETYGAIDGFEYLNPNARIFKSIVRFDFVHARAQADSAASRCAAFPLRGPFSSVVE